MGNHTVRPMRLTAARRSIPQGDGGRSGAGFSTREERGGIALGVVRRRCTALLSRCFLPLRPTMLHAATSADDCAAAQHDKCVSLTMSGTCVTLTRVTTPGGWQSSVAQQTAGRDDFRGVRSRVFFCCSVLVSFSQRIARRVLAHPGASMAQSPRKSHAVSRSLLALLTSCVVCVFFTRCAGV